jgi:glycosyltransferase involved in cell wall biosynthesis
MTSTQAAPKRPRALIFGSFARTIIASGLDTALENLLESPLGDRYELVLVSVFRGERSTKGMVQRLGYGSWLFAQTILRLGVSRSSVVDVHSVSGRDFLKTGAVVLAARAVRVPILLRIHGGKFDRAFESASPTEQRIVRTILRIPDWVILCSKRWDNVVRSIEPRARTAVIPNSVDCDIFAEAMRRRPSTANDVLMLGTFLRKKGPF